MPESSGRRRVYRKQSSFYSFDCKKKRKERGHEYFRKHQHNKRESGFFAIRIAEHYEYRGDWYSEGEVASLVLTYDVVLQSVLRAHPDLQKCLTRCWHCRISFITDPRNAGRIDLGCPFGCREAHRKECSKERSVEYYRGDCGKIKKKIQNEKRRKVRNDPPPEPEAAVSIVNEFPLQIMLYVQMLTSLIEGRLVSMNEIEEMLARKLRQQGMVHSRKIDHIVASLREPPS